MQISTAHVGFALLLSSVMMFFFKTDGKKKLEDSLDETQKAVLSKITSERLKIYLSSLAVGGMVGILYLKAEGFSNALPKIGTATGIALVITYFSYQLWPKSTYMVQHLEGTQVDLWVTHYRSFLVVSHLSFVVGLVAYFLLCKWFCERHSK